MAGRWKIRGEWTWAPGADVFACRSSSRSITCPGKLSHISRMFSIQSCNTRWRGLHYRLSRQRSCLCRSRSSTWRSALAPRAPVARARPCFRTVDREMTSAVFVLLALERGRRAMRAGDGWRSGGDSVVGMLAALKDCGGELRKGRMSYSPLRAW